MVLYNKEDTNQIIFELKNGKSLICPTDTVNGILTRNKEDIFRLKKRAIYKKIVLFIPNISYVKTPNIDFIKLSKKFWPGPLTLIYNNVSYRIPDSILIGEILEGFGPLYCSSANISGETPSINTIDAYARFSGKEKLIVVYGNSSTKKASTIYNVNTKLIVRHGNIELKDIQLCLK